MDDILRMRGGQAVRDCCRDLDRRLPAKRSFDQAASEASSSRSSITANNSVSVNVNS